VFAWRALKILASDFSDLEWNSFVGALGCCLVLLLLFGVILLFGNLSFKFLSVVIEVSALLCENLYLGC
jgi:hypothetical protein